MGFLDNDVNNSFDSMFDYNRDGKLDYSEQAMQIEFLENLSRPQYSDDEDKGYNKDIDCNARYSYNGSNVSQNRTTICEEKSNPFWVFLISVLIGGHFLETTFDSVSNAPDVLCLGVVVFSIIIAFSVSK